MVKKNIFMTASLFLIAFGFFFFLCTIWLSCFYDYFKRMTNTKFWYFIHLLKQKKSFELLHQWPSLTDLFKFTYTYIKFHLFIHVLAKRFSKIILVQVACMVFWWLTNYTVIAPSETWVLWGIITNRYIQIQM